MSPRAAEDRCVLVVEDSDDDFVALERVYLRVAPERRIVRARTYEEAVGWLTVAEREVSPAVVLADLKLGGWLGYEIIERLRDRPGAPPVVIMSGSRLPSDVDRCSRAGAAGYLVKPLSPDALAEQLRAFDARWFGEGSTRASA